jgi:hypothetical protein
VEKREEKKGNKMESNDWIYFDPDYRKNPPKTGAYCERCQKLIKDTNKAVRVEIYADYPVGSPEDQFGYCRKLETGKHFIGLDCWKIITKNQ